MTLRLAWSPRAISEADRLQDRERRRIVGALERFAETRHGDVAKLRGIDPPEYRLRVGEYRVRFRYGAAGELELLRVGHRRDVYRR